MNYEKDLKENILPFWLNVGHRQKRIYPSLCRVK